MPLRFEFVDDGRSRTDLAVRRETKFTFDSQRLDAVRTLLAGNCQRQIHNQPVSTVRSIYFDDSRLAACHANLDGLGKRRKLRLRWYDQLLPGTDLYLEVKWRDNRITGKHRFQLRSNELIGARDYRDLASALRTVVPSTVLRDFEANLEPVVVVEYKREHFASADGALRLTIDYDLRFYRQWGRQRISMEFPCRMERLALVEGKTPVGREGELREMMYPLTMRASKCSKYVHGCQSLGLIGTEG